MLRHMGSIASIHGRLFVKQNESKENVCITEVNFLFMASGTLIRFGEIHSHELEVKHCRVVLEVRFMGLLLLLLDACMQAHSNSRTI